MDLQTVALTGKTGGKLKDSANHCICVPSNETPRIQEYHGMISHMLSELVEQALCKRESRVSGSQRIIAEIRFQEFKLTVSLLFLG